MGQMTAQAVCDDAMADEIGAYWDERAESYSQGVLGELHGEAGRLWKPVLARLSAEPLEAAHAEGRIPHVADLGCGPGFMSVVFSGWGCRVSALDGSAEMLAAARANVAAEGASLLVDYHEGDVAELPFADNTFDLAVLRNVTWLLQDPQAAYAEWLRVLRPGGKLLVFDANWYRYLVDPAIDAQRRIDQDDPATLGWGADISATDDQERRCEEIALALPLTHELRPAWDIEVLKRAGASRVRADVDAWQELWTEGEKAFYGTSPMFSIEAWK